MGRPLFDAIIIKRSSFESSDEQAMMEANQKYYWELLQSNLFLDEELPDDCRALERIWWLIGETLNGGLDQYPRNQGWSDVHNQLMLDALHRMGATAYAGIFDDFRALVNSDRTRLLARMQRSLLEAQPPQDSVQIEIMGLGSRFFNEYRKRPLMSYCENYLRTHKSLIIVDDHKWAAEVHALTRLNPQYEHRRREAEIRQRDAEKRKHRFRRIILQLNSIDSVACLEINFKVGNVEQATIAGEDRRIAVYTGSDGSKFAYLELDGYVRLYSYPELVEIAQLRVDTFH